ncbi:MAG: phosphoribosyltransferase [Mariniphaga sp.]|nr:phosphoribosyltransferase [Mariniphaga sp.]
MVPLSFKNISERLKNMELPEIDIVIGIGTGGVVPASIVAFQLGCELQVITLNFRDIKNNPQHESPIIVSKPEGLDLSGKKVLLVDDVSVSGKTLNEAKKHLKGGEIKTLTMKGKADYVLFPEIKDCVIWPWK